MLKKIIIWWTVYCCALCKMSENSDSDMDLSDITPGDFGAVGMEIHDTNSESKDSYFDFTSIASGQCIPQSEFAEIDNTSMEDYEEYYVERDYENYHVFREKYGYYAPDKFETMFSGQDFSCKEDFFQSIGECMISYNDENIIEPVVIHDICTVIWNLGGLFFDFTVNIWSYYCDVIMSKGINHKDVEVYHVDIPSHVKRSNFLKYQSPINDFETRISKYSKQWQNYRHKQSGNNKYCTAKDEKMQAALDMHWKDGEQSISKICRAVWGDVKHK
eukprot:134735_1